MAINKINGAAMSAVSKVNAIAKDSISKVDGYSIGAAPASSLKVAMVVGGAGHILWNSGTLGNVDHWHLLDFGGDVYRDITWGRDEDGTECWIVATNKTARPVIVAKSDGSDNWIPSGSSNWTNIKPSGGPWAGTWGFRGYRVARGDHTNNARATFMMGAMNNSTLSTYVTGGITNSANWSQYYRVFDSSGANSAIYGMSWNRSSSASESTFALTIGGDVWLNANGTGSGDAGEWTKVYDVSSGTPWRLQYGNGYFVGGGRNTSGLGSLTGSMASGKPGAWGLMNAPASGERAMRSAATDMSGTWVMCGDDGYVWRSTDNAVTWTELDRVPDQDGGSTYRDWYDIAYDNDGTWVMVGERSLATSENGINFTPFDYPTSGQTYQGIAFNLTNTSQ